MEFTQKTLPEQHYLFVEKLVSFENPAAIGQAMGEAFTSVMSFVAMKGLRPLSMPISLYLDMPSDGKMTFRGGVFVSAEDADKAEGEIKADTIPAGDVMTTVHVGPYSHLNVSHKALWDHVDSLGLSKAMPVWEHYIDDPTQVPEADCRTEIYRSIG